MDININKAGCKGHTYSFLEHRGNPMKQLELSICNQYDVAMNVIGREDLCEIEVDNYIEDVICKDVNGRPSSVIGGNSHCGVKDKCIKDKDLDGTNSEGLSIKFQSDIWPMNVLEQKESFFKMGLTPEFKLKGSTIGIEKMINDINGQIKFNYFNEAKRILDISLRKYKSLDTFVLHAFGKPISLDECKEKVTQYLKDNDLDGSIQVIWSNKLICSAQMCSTITKGKKNEREYTLLIKSSDDNTFIRENGISCLLNHEIGTHYIRSYNDSLQVWVNNRHKYGITPIKCHDGMKTEEGLACIHTILQSRVKYLSMPALLYYSSCMAMYLSFKQLFDHLSRYVKNVEQRWKHCMRIKRILKSTSDIGGYGKDQRYFEGAVEILRNIDKIDFYALICGKIIWSDIPKVTKIVKRDLVKIPHFMENNKEYMRTIKEIATLNGLTSKPDSKFIPHSRKETMQCLGVTDEQINKIPRRDVYSGCGDSEINVAKLCGCTLYSGIKHDVHFDVNELNKRPIKKRQIPIIFELETRRPIIP